MMKILNLTIAPLLMFFLYSCNGDTSEKKNNAVTNTDTVTSKQNIVERDTLIDSKNFQDFWLGFRNIVLSKEYKGINEVVELPFEIYGFEDSDPRINLSNVDSINILFKKFLLDTRVNDFPNNYELIKNVTNLENFPEYIASEYSRSIEHMDFRNDGSRWKLSRIYLDTKELTLTGKP